jgi:hypothetical protein
MAAEIRRPSTILGKQNKFSDSEVGLTHPRTPAFIKLSDNGDMYIMASPDVGIILNAARKSITLVGDVVKFVTKEDDGLNWNDLAFNAKATKYSEPTFVIPKKQTSSIYDEIDQFLD